jgi:HAD superfamily hydrolase (TIGR01509 family)
MIKAIIFDCFGVLVTDGWHPFKKKYFSNEAEKDAEASRLIDLTTKGTMSYKIFLKRISELANIDAHAVHEEINNNAPNQEIFNLIDELSPKYKIGLLSNAVENWLSRLFTPEQLAKFDATVLSCDISANKPDVRAYEAIASKLNCDLSECLFIDDVYNYVVGAKKVGMKAIHYKNPDQATKEIRLLINQYG